MTALRQAQGIYVNIPSKVEGRSAQDDIRWFLLVTLHTLRITK